jgi:hypothetical protein
MKFGRFTPLMIILLMTIILVTGCLEQKDVKNTSTQITPSFTRTVPIEQTSQASCPPSLNKTPHIVINPVSNFTLGDILEITGTTNIGESKKIHYHVASPYKTVPVGVQSPNFGVTDGDIWITNQSCQEQTWSFILDTNNFTTWSSSFYIYMWTDNWTSPNGVRNESSIRTHFNASGRSWGEIK